MERFDTSAIMFMLLTLLLMMGSSHEVLISSGVIPVP